VTKSVIPIITDEAVCVRYWLLVLMGTCFFAALSSVWHKRAAVRYEGLFHGDVCSLIHCTEDGPYIVERVFRGHTEHQPNPPDSSPLHRHSIVYVANRPFHPWYSLSEPSLSQSLPLLTQKCCASHSRPTEKEMNSWIKSFFLFVCLFCAQRYCRHSDYFNDVFTNFSGPGRFSLLEASDLIKNYLICVPKV